MRKFACVLFFIISLFVFGQSEEVPYVAPITEVPNSNVLIQDSLLFVNYQNQIKVFDLSSDSTETICKIPCESVIRNFVIEDSTLFVITSLGQYFMESCNKLYVFDITNIDEPEIIASHILDDIDINPRNFFFKNNIFNAGTVAYPSTGVLVRYNIDNLETSTLERYHSITYMSSSLAIAKDSHSLFFYDISDFNSPIIKKELPYQGNFTTNDSLLVICKDDSSLVYDITNPDTMPLISTIHINATPRYIYGNFIFMSSENKLFKYDISEVSAPALVDSIEYYRGNLKFSDSLLFNSARCFNLNSMELISDFSDEEMDAKFEGTSYCDLNNSNLVYSFIRIEDMSIDTIDHICMQIFDITNLSEPSLIINILRELCYTPIYENNNLLLTTDYFNERNIKVIDFSDLTNISSSYITLDYPVLIFKMIDTLAYISYGEHGIEILNCFDLSYIESIYENHDVHIKDFYTNDNHVFMSGYDSTITVLDKETFSTINFMYFESEINDIIEYNNHLFVNVEGHGVKTFDISDISSPIELDSSLPRCNEGLYLINGNLFINESSNIVYNFDLTDPINPIMLDLYYTAGNLFSSQYMGCFEEIHDEYILYDFELYDLSNPDSPNSILFWHDVTGIGYVSFCGKNNIFITSSDDEIVRLYYNNSDSSPVMIRDIFTSTNTTYFADSMLFTFKPNYNSGIDMYDISSLTESIEEPRAEIGTPEEFSLGTYPNPFNSAVSIETKGAEKIEIYDINGKKVAQYNTNENTNITWTPEENINSGVYLIKAMNNNSQLSDGSRELTGKVIYIK